MADENILLDVKDLKVYFPARTASRASLWGRTREYIKAVDGISFVVPKGSTFGLVGESGCGKSTTARTVVRLTQPNCGRILFDGQDITQASKRELLGLRRDIQMIFQDPYASLSARMTVQSIIAEPLQILRNNRVIEISNEEIDERVSLLLRQVGLRESMKKRFPHEFSGGQRQRIGIARAIASYPKLVICDEPISALDVSVQAQILNLLRHLQRELKLTYLFIAHDLRVVEYICDRIGVMYLGSMMEVADSADLNARPLHPYTQMLLSAVLVPDPVQSRNISHPAVRGEAEFRTEDRGCPFYHRCPQGMAHCQHQKPVLREIGPGHLVACHLHDRAMQ